MRPHVNILLAGIALVLGFGCSSETGTVVKQVDINTLKPAGIDTGFLTILSVIKVYPAKGQCNGSAGHPSVYVCKNETSGDKLYVFEPCKKVSPLVANDSKHKYRFCIINRRILSDFPASIKVDLPKNIDIPQNAAYFFSNVYVLNE